MMTDAGQEQGQLKALEQQRAAKAWAQISTVPDGKGKEYYAAVRKAPAMIKMNGLGQTLAFLLAKEEKEASNIRGAGAEQLGAHGLLYKHLEEWLIGEAPIPWTRTTDNPTLMERVLAEDSVVYRQATREALAYLGWLKRFAEAQLSKDSGSGTEE